MNIMKSGLLLAALAAASIGAAHAQNSGKTGDFGVIGQSTGDTYTTVSSGDWNADLDRERERIRLQDVATRNRSDEERTVGPAD